MAKRPNTHKAVRDARTGQFVRASEAKRRPSTTVTETIRNLKKKR